MLRYLTSGESHGVELTALLDGMPSGLTIRLADIDADLKRRQGGYGRGDRQRIESDKVIITSGVRFAKTLGSPISLVIKNSDHENWLEAMSVDAVRSTVDKREVTKARPGHADLAGAMKYDHSDFRNILERSSARETAARVAVGAVCKALLSEFGISVYSWVTGIGGVGTSVDLSKESAVKLHRAAEVSSVRCPDKAAEKRIIAKIKRVKKAGDSLGGIFEVVATGVPPGLGTHTQWDGKLKARLAMALMSIQAIKGVEMGMGFGVAENPGSKVHDEIFYRKPRKGAKKGSHANQWPLKGGFYRKTNNAGGIEGGISNGEQIIVRAAMKPIPTLYKPLRSVDLITKKPYEASIERSDICAVPAASVIGEAVVAFELARAFLDKFGGDSTTEIRRNYRGYLRQLQGI
ncbi:MAG: chorismate synthase [Thermodesulfobacteriota bacterium]